MPTQKPSDRYARMTWSDYSAMVGRLEADDPVGEPISAAEWNAIKRSAAAERKRRQGGARPGAGRKPKPADQRVARVLVSMPRDLLAAIDLAAKARDVTRAALIAQAMRRHLRLGHRG